MRRRSLVRIRRSSVPGFLVGLGVASLAGCLSSSDDSVPGEESSALATTSLALSADDADYHVVPGGLKVHRSCVHELADNDIVDQKGGVIRSADGNVTAVPPPCAFPARRIDGSERSGESLLTDNGWIEEAHWWSPRDMRQFGASFHVPAPPRIYTGQLIYLFPALETDNGDSIMQPVLQYGPNGWFGGQYWSFASWAGGAEWNGNYYHSPPKTTIGNPMRGGIWWTNDCRAGGCVWHIQTCGVVCTELAIRTDRTWPLVFGGAVEVYKIDHCDKYPSTYEDFYDFFLQDAALTNPTPTWEPRIHVTTCQERVVVRSPNLIEFDY